MDDTYLTRGIDPRQMASVFRTAARLWRAAPWDVILTDECLISVSARTLGLDDAVISVVGQHRSIFGFMLFPGGLADFSEFHRRARGVRREGRGPSHVSLTFVDRSDVQPRMRREVSSHSWELADPRMFPLLTAVEDGLGGPTTARQAEIVEVMALVLAELVESEPRLSDATFGSDSFDRTIAVSAFAGSHDVCVTAPCVPLPEDPELDEPLALVRELPAAAPSGPAPTALSAEERRKARNRRKSERQGQR